MDLQSEEESCLQDVSSGYPSRLSEINYIPEQELEAWRQLGVLAQLLHSHKEAIKLGLVLRGCLQLLPCLGQQLAEGLQTK